MHARSPLLAYLDDMPDLPPATLILLILLVTVGWLATRIGILRRQQRSRAADGAPPPSAWAPLRWLASRSWIMPALAVVALLLVGAIALTWAG